MLCVLHFRRVWFSLQKLQSFHTKRKKHISNKMDSEEEKKEDKGEHINLKVKDQVPFSLSRDLSFRARRRERELCAFCSFFSRRRLFKNETQRRRRRRRRRRRSDDARSRRTRLTPRTLPRDAQDNAEVHFKVRTGTKFKKVRLFDFFSLVARSLVEERNYALALFSNPRRRELISAPKIFSSLSHNVRIKQIFDAFLQRKSLQPGSVRFLFDGERVREDQSPQELDMEDGDSLDVMMEQVGGEK